MYRFALVSTVVYSASSAAMAQPFALGSADWVITHDDNEMCVSTGYFASCSFSHGVGAGSVELGPFLPTSPFNPNHSYRNLPSIHFRGNAGFNGGFSGPSVSIPYLIAGTVEFSTDRPIERPLVSGFGQAITMGFGLDTLLLQAELRDSSGAILYHDSSTGFQSAGLNELGFVDLLPPGEYSLTVGFGGILRLGNTQGHFRTANAYYDAWLVIPAPASGWLWLAGGLVWPVRRLRRRGVSRERAR